MKFFDPRGNQISYPQWLDIYRAYYFCKICSWVEGFVTGQKSLLTKSSPLSSQDLMAIMAWKTGHIDYWISHASQQIHYKPVHWAAKPIDAWGNDFSQGIQWLVQNMTTILNQVNANPQYLLTVPHLPGFGSVYRLTVLFFISHGSHPIYDQFAHKAALAIEHNLPPWTDFSTLGTKIYKEVSLWNDYEDFKQLLRTINLQPSSGMFISRDDDQALWAYGHLFKG